MTRIDELMEDCIYSSAIEWLDDDESISSLQYAACWAVNNKIWLSHKTIDEFVKLLHKILFEGKFEAFEAWAVRKIQVYVGKHIPPAPEHVQLGLDELYQYIRDLTPAQIHYRFEQIHPFVDGNWRIGRLILPFIDMMRPKTEKPKFYSKYIYEHRQEYYDSFESEDKMIDFFLSINKPQWQKPKKQKKQ